MQTTTELISFSSIKRNQIVLFTKANALKFLAACQNEDIRLLGIDGFVIDGVNIQPSLEHSIDFSSKYFREVLSKEKNYLNVYEAAWPFLQERPESMYFEFTY